MIKNRIILGISVMAISMGLMTACGNTAATAPKNENTNVSENATAVAGLQEYEGFYSMTTTEEFDGFAITTTTGYKFNGDGTGVCYGQDVVDFTWNETELHFGDSTTAFAIEDGKLTVDGLVYDKIAGNLIAPNPYTIDTSSVDNGIFSATIADYGITEADGKVTISAEIYAEETFDIVDVSRMAEGDVLYINGSLFTVNTVEELPSGLRLINGGLEEGGCALRAVDESNCFVFAGMDDEMSYSFQGVADLAVSADVKFIDNADPTVEKEYAGSEAVAAIKEAVKDYPMSCGCCKIMVENGEIIEINRVYRP